MSEINAALEKPRTHSFTLGGFPARLAVIGAPLSTQESVTLGDPRENYRVRIKVPMLVDGSMLPGEIVFIVAQNVLDAIRSGELIGLNEVTLIEGIENAKVVDGERGERVVTSSSCPACGNSSDGDAHHGAIDLRHESPSFGKREHVCAKCAALLRTLMRAHLSRKER